MNSKHKQGKIIMENIGSTVLLDCRKFKCENNKNGKCILSRVTLEDAGTPLISQVICVEAKDKETVMAAQSGNKAKS